MSRNTTAIILISIAVLSQFFWGCSEETITNPTTYLHDTTLVTSYDTVYLVDTVVVVDTVVADLCSETQAYYAAVRFAQEYAKTVHGDRVDWSITTCMGQDIIGYPDYIGAPTYDEITGEITVKGQFQYYDLRPEYAHLGLLPGIYEGVILMVEPGEFELISMIM